MSDCPTFMVLFAHWVEEVTASSLHQKDELRSKLHVY